MENITEIITSFWIKNNIIKKYWEKNKDNDTYNILEGPPFCTGKMHCGHLANKYIKNTIERFNHQEGKLLPNKATWDTHGLPIEHEIDKKLGIKTHEEILLFGIENYNNECKKIVSRCVEEWKEDTLLAGTWLDYENDVKTLDFNYMNSVWWGFSKIFKKNLVYKSYKVLPYSTECKTSLSNFEANENYKKIVDETLYVKFKLNNINRYLLVWTTTPWTLPSNMAIAINKNIIYVVINFNDEELIIAKNLVDKIFTSFYAASKTIKKKDKYIIIEEFYGSELLEQIYIPHFTCINNIFKIIHGDFVKDTNGTGIVHIAPSYGDDDYNVCIINKIIDKKDKLFMTIDDDGYFVNNLQGLEFLSNKYYKNYPKDKKSFDGNMLIIKYLNDINMIFLIFNYEHDYPFCWRSDTPLMYRAVENWFINVESIKNKMIQLNKNINWIPSNIGSERFHNWISDAKDWCIGRNRFWGSPIPIWCCETDEDDYIIISSSYELEKLCNLEENSINDIHRDKIDNYVIIKDGKTYKRVNFVFDCWFESGCMPFAFHGYPYITSNINKTVDFISEGIDQTRGWFYTLLVISAAIFEVEPFKNVIVNGLLLADDGKKMSKHLKNYKEVRELLNLYGSDALRLYFLNSPITKANALKFNENDVKDMNKNVILHLINVLKFYLEYKIKFDKENGNINLEDTITLPLDIYIIYQTKNIIKLIREKINNFQLAEAVKNLMIFVDILSLQYVKLNRSNIKKEKSSLYTLYIVLYYSSVYLAPLLPYVSEYIFNNLKFPFIHGIFQDTDSVHLVDITSIKLPELNEEDIKIANEIKLIMYILSQLNTLRSKNNIDQFTYYNEVIIKTSQSSNDILSIYIELLKKEGKILNIKLESFDIQDIKIITTPNFTNIKEIYPNDIKTIKDIIINLNDNDKNILYNNTPLCKEELIKQSYTIYKNLVNIIIEPVQNNEYISEYSFYNDDNYSILLNTEETEETKNINISSKIAKQFQLMRKKQKLHTWDPIILGISTNITTLLNDIIFNVCEHKPIYYDHTLNDKYNIILKENYNDLFLYLLK